MEEQNNPQVQLMVSDKVWARVVQIVQEAILLGIDCVDLLREIRLCHCHINNDVLVLTDAYVKHVLEMHERLLKELEEKKAVKQAKLVVDPNAS
jgi:hypothetical protein